MGGIPNHQQNKHISTTPRAAGVFEVLTTLGCSTGLLWFNARILDVFDAQGKKIDALETQLKSLESNKRVKSYVESDVGLDIEETSENATEKLDRSGPSR